MHNGYKELLLLPGRYVLRVFFVRFVLL